MKIKIEGFETDIERVVVKLGTKQITDLNKINRSNIRKIIAEIANIRMQGIEFILTVSGAVGLGIAGYEKNIAIEKMTIPEKQALAGVGQARLMDIFREEFAKFKTPVAKADLPNKSHNFHIPEGLSITVEQDDFESSNVQVFMKSKNMGFETTVMHNVDIEDIRSSIKSINTNITVGQVLLTHTIFDNRSAYLNARNTLNTMLEMGIIPIINENDSVAVDEIKFGDNDRLGALVALLTDADIYIMLTDTDGFYLDYDSDNRRLLKVVNLDKEPELDEHAGDKAHHFTSGGMRTKLEAAKITNRSCIPTVIANGFTDNILKKVLNNIEEGTIFISDRCKLNYKKRWISGKKSRGSIIVDKGATKALKNHKSLLASGIKSVDGNFKSGDSITIVDENEVDIAIGLCNYDASEVKRIVGKKNDEIETVLGYKNHYNSVVHIDNLVLL